MVDMQTIPAPANSFVRTLDSMADVFILKTTGTAANALATTTKKELGFFGQLNMKDCEIQWG